MSKRRPAGADGVGVAKQRQTVSERARAAAIVAVVDGAERDEVLAAARCGKLSAAAAEAIADGAQQAVILAAGTGRRAELRRALDDVAYLVSKTECAETVGDRRVHLDALKERSRLLRLYDGPVEVSIAASDDEESAEAQQLAAIGGHLLPLGLASPDYPLVEHARLAAQRVRDAGRSRAG